MPIVLFGQPPVNDHNQEIDQGMLYLDDIGFSKRNFSLTKDEGSKGHQYLYKDKNAPSGAYILISFEDLGKGIYQFYTEASVINASNDKPDKTFWIQWQWNQEEKVQRIIFDAFRGAKQYIGKFEFKGIHNKLKIWLPEGVGLASIAYKKVLPKVPKELSGYTPSVVPPKAHPRLWVTPSFLPVLKERLKSSENKWAWNKVQKKAHLDYEFNQTNTVGVYYSDSLEKIIKAKAFYYLITADKNVGNDAIQLLLAYYKRLEFGNIVYGDISRQIGRAMYVGSLVYDWCYALIGKDNKTFLRDKMMVLARKMEVGWPPFKYPIVNGHADEAMISRDLLSMSIAIYNENPLPYKYTSYALLEQLAPMMQFEYQSSRHNQGVDYGAYRFGWEMHGAMLFYRMMGYKVYPDNLKNLPHYWLYMRLPNGYMFRDGDMFRNYSKQPGHYYWTQPRTMLLCYAYFSDPLMKGEFVREGGFSKAPVLYLLLNDPKLKTVKSPAQLPLTHDFGKIAGGMLARTGWDNSRLSDDVIAEIRGGGYLFGNHEHADAGAIQLYYHGMQFGDIGLYLAYGTPYDYNFNKRSVAHSMVLAYDSSEKLYFRAKAKDGGARFNQRFPVSPQQAKTDPWFNAGAVLSTDFGPDAKEPEFSYYKAELAPAYSAKISSYTRSFCFFNLNNSDVPAALVVVDDITTSKSGVKKYWQLNAYKQPKISESSILLHNQTAGITGYTKVNMVYPKPKDRQIKVMSKDSSRSVFGTYFGIKHNYMPESGASRILITPKDPSRRQRFVTVFQMMEDTTKSLSVSYKRRKGYNEIRFGNVVYLLGVDRIRVTDSIKIQVEKSNSPYTFLATGLEPGFWHIRKSNSTKSRNYYVYPGKNTLYTKLTGGAYILKRGRDYNGKYYDAPTGKTFYLDYKLVPTH